MAEKKEQVSKKSPVEPVFGLAEIPLLQETKFSASLTLRQQAIYYVWVSDPYIKRKTLAEKAGVSISTVKRFFKENETKIRDEKDFLYENLVDTRAISAIYHAAVQNALRDPTDTKASKPFVDHVLNRSEGGNGVKVSISFGNGSKNFPPVYDEEETEAEVVDIGKAEDEGV